jgi:hypothetical protein
VAALLVRVAGVVEGGGPAFFPGFGRSFIRLKTTALRKMTEIRENSVAQIRMFLFFLF